jgi:hypothetical protein
VHSLLAYGANPNAELSKLIVPETTLGMTLEYSTSGSILTEAAKSGNPDLVREILHYPLPTKTRTQKPVCRHITPGRRHLSVQRL